jgi:hypothetical protein
MDAMIASALPWLIAFGAALALAGAVFALWQSLRTAFGAATPGAPDATMELTSDARATLIDRKNAMLRNLKDLEFERQVGKISEQDFVKLDALYRQKAREVLEQLDVEVGPWRTEAEKLVKAAVAKVKKDQPKPAEAEEPKLPPERAPQLKCPKCEVVNDPDATFCKKCATRLIEEPAAPASEEKPA